LGRFAVSGGVETGPGEYTATIDWGDGAPPESGSLSVTDDTILVSGHHSYTGAGLMNVVVTLTDDTGGSVAVADILVVAPDVSNRVRLVSLGGPWNPKAQSFLSSGTITNISGLDIPGPLHLIVNGLPGGDTLANADGFTTTGLPYRLIKVPKLQPGQTVGPITLQFSDPSLTPFDYSVTTIAGPPHTGTASTAGVVGFVRN